MTGLTRKFMRLRGFMRKEVIQIRRDPSSLVLALVMPVILLFLFGYGLSLDAQNVPVALVFNDRGSAAGELAGRLELSRYFEPTRVATMQEATRLLNRRKVSAIIQIQSDFSRQLAMGKPPSVQVILDGTDSNQALLIQGYTAGILANWSAQRAARGLAVQQPAVTVDPRIWFNDAATSTWYLVPGLVALVMTLIGVLLTALVVAREWERGTMEAVLATPLRINEIMAGKLLPYFVLGLMGLGLSTGLGVWLFGVPFRGSQWVYMVVSMLFLLASLGLGLFISAAVRKQFVASQVSILVGFLPAFFLSGLLFDLGSTPLPIRLLSYVIPARYYIDAIHTLFLAGDVWPVIWPNLLALAVMATLFIALARSRLTKRLEN